MAITPRNQIVPRAEQGGAKKPSDIFLSEGTLTLLQRAFGDEHTARRVATTLLSVYQRTPKLQNCTPASIIAAALEGEGAKNLSLSNGDYAIVPYGDKATFQLMVTGLKRLCLRSLAYADIDAFDVREGEYKGRDPQTRRPIIEWIEDDDEREQLPIVGYYAFYKLNERYNGFTKSIYWTHDKILRHADRYSKAFSLEKYKKLLDGEITGRDADWLRNGTPWYADPNDEGHMKMCKKTVLKQLLGDGFAPKEIADIINEDSAVERTGEPVIYDAELFAGAMPAVEQKNEEPQTEPEPQEPPAEEPTPVIERPANPLPKRGRPPKEKPIQPPASKEIASAPVPVQPAEAEEDLADFDTESFFGEGGELY